MILLCIGIFIFKAIEVSLGTIKTFYTVKGKNLVASVTSFFEILIWFIVAKKALVTSNSSIFIAVSFALGYTLGTLLGSFVANKYIKGNICIQAITKKNNKRLINKLKDEGYGITIVPLKNKSKNKQREMFIIETNKNEFKNIMNIFSKLDTKAFLIVNESRVISK